MAESGTTGSAEPFTEDAARRALEEAGRRVGLADGSAELIRMGSNAVFRVDAETIARVAPSLAHRPNADKQIAVARWLELVGYRAVRATAVDQPVEADGRVVTFWASVSAETVYAPIKDVAELIKCLHRLEAPATLALPSLCPFGGSSDPVPEFPGLPDGDAGYLQERFQWARETFSALPFVLPRGVVHGDANVGNVLLDDAGEPVLIDLDSFAIGPREWDLIQTALFYDRLGWHTADEYRTFVEVYEVDVTEWEGYPTLADMREIAMTSWVSKKAANSHSAAREARKRIAAIRSGRSRRDWCAY